jgi:hypothetical protein
MTNGNKEYIYELSVGAIPEMLESDWGFEFSSDENARRKEETRLKRIFLREFQDTEGHNSSDAEDTESLSFDTGDEVTATSPGGLLSFTLDWKKIDLYKIKYAVEQLLASTEMETSALNLVIVSSIQFLEATSRAIKLSLNKKPDRCVLVTAKTLQKEKREIFSAKDISGLFKKTNCLWPDNSKKNCGMWDETSGKCRLRIKRESTDIINRLVQKDVLQKTSGEGASAENRQPQKGEALYVLQGFFYKA